MKESIKKRIEAVRRGEVPEGYRRTKDIGIAPSDWRVGQLSDVLHNKQRPVPKPDEPYWRLGIRSWAKGTFHAYVDDPAAVDMDELYVVQENDLVVNITFAWEHAIAVASKEDDGLLVSHRFPTYTFDGGNVPEYYKAVVSQQYFRDMLDHISPGGAGRNRVLNRKDFLALPCHIPPIAEQKKIAEILATCDRVIELKQCKIDELNKLKQTYLRKMFPQEGQTVPEVRFPGFSDPWEQRKLGQVGSVSMCRRIFKEQTSESGDIPFYKIGTFGGQADAYISSELFSEYKSKYPYPKEGDILISASGSVGRTVEFTGKNEYFQDSNIVWLSHDDRLDNPFLKCFYSVVKWAGIEGSTIKRLYNDNILNTVISLPTVDEQRQIGSFFKELDNLIALHQRELEEYGKYKKALMQLLLTGLVRVNA